MWEIRTEMLMNVISPLKCDFWTISFYFIYIYIFFFSLLRTSLPEILQWLYVPERTEIWECEQPAYTGINRAIMVNK